jgi:hypothetical protein
MTPDHPLPPDHAARRRPTPYPEPRVGQVWRDPNGSPAIMRRVWRRPGSNTPTTVVVEYPDQRRELVAAVVILTEWDRVEDDR